MMSNHIKQDDPNELAKLRSAAEKGDREAQLKLGTELLRGNQESLVPEGLEWIEQAALNQNPYAIFCLAYLMLHSSKVDDFNKSIATYMLKSIDSCEQEVMGLDKLSDETFWKVALNFGYRLIEPEPRRGIDVLTIAADRGSTLAMGILAQFYLTDKYGHMDKTKALALLTRAAELDNFQAQEQLGQIYSSRKICAPIFWLASHWQNKAAETKGKGNQILQSFKDATKKQSRNNPSEAESHPH